MDDNNIVEIKIPIKKEYSQILRLAAAGIGNQAKFNLDIIEDVKVIVSEVLNSLIETDSKRIDIKFKIENKRIYIEFEACDKKNILRGANEMTLPILEAFASTVELDNMGRLIVLIEA